MSDKQPLRLHVPEPKARPGESHDFSEIVIPPAGSLRRPPIDEPEHTMHEHAFGMIRVLDENGRPMPHTLVEIWQANSSGRYIHTRDQHPAPLDPRPLRAISYMPRSAVKIGHSRPRPVPSKLLPSFFSP